MSAFAMNSWNLLRYLLAFDRDRALRDPIFQRELARPPLWQHVASWMARATGALLVFSGMVCYVSVLLVFYLKNLLILLIPVLGLWGLLITVTLAPAVAQERAQRTWDTLRTTPFELSDLLLNKAGGALWWLRSMIRLLMGVLVVVAVGVGLVSLILSSTSVDENNPLHLPPAFICVSAVMMPVVVASLFVIDRAQFFVLTLVAILAGSASTRNVRTAIVAAIGILFAVWLSDIAVAALLLQLQVDSALGWDLLSVAALGPLAGYLGRFNLNMLVLAGAATVLAREALIYGLWRWTMHVAASDLL